MFLTEVKLCTQSCRDLSQNVSLQVLHMQRVKPQKGGCVPHAIPMPYLEFQVIRFPHYGN